MNIEWEAITLDLKNTFRIAHGASDQRHNVIVKIGNGMGEAAGVPYLGESQASIIQYLEELPEIDWDPFQIEDILNNLPPGSKAARAAIDMALHDWLGTVVGQPIYRLLGLNAARIPQTSFTIGMDEPDQMADQARNSKMPVIKIKLGSHDDEAIVSAVRQACPEISIRVDANAAWSREQAADLIPRLAHYNLEFVEQPLSVGDIEGLRWLRALNLGTPIFADENIKTCRDVLAHVGAIDGIVIKLMKTCGLREAVRVIHVARALEMKIMIGCMVESSLAVTAAAQIAPMCDYADLDAPLLIHNDPFQGLAFQDANILLPNGPGFGVINKPGNK